MIDFDEECDTNTQGCTDCKLDPGYCLDPPNKVIPCSDSCGDFIKDAGEECDNGNKTGCINCDLDDGYCLSGPNKVERCCGNGLKNPGEQCDDSNRDSDDCCSSFC